jgi:hypothetical protein
MLVGKTQAIAVAGGVETMPVKKPLTKLKIPARGVKSTANRLAIFEKIYRTTLKQSNAIWSISSINF